MPGIDDVDRQFRRVATAPTDGELRAEAEARAATGECVTLPERMANEFEAGRARGYQEGKAAALALTNLGVDEDRREVRRQALICAVEAVQHVAPRPLLIEEVLKTAAAFERYLLGDADPPKGERDFRTGEPVKNQGEWTKD